MWNHDKPQSLQIEMAAAQERRRKDSEETASLEAQRKEREEKKKKHREAKLLEILEPSEHRIDPKCQHANVCGGCSWQHIPYSKQVGYKGQQVNTAELQWRTPPHD